jgi:lipopolysaccharide/colanic/teichoic acid biosynthesis glycosyltransferase
MACRVRRVGDAFVASIALVVLAPLWLAIATAILLEGGGGVVFTQTRVGRGGRRFRILKFRTMRPAGGGRPGDVPLPQLVNILAGEMMLIGPRPLIPEEDAIVSKAWARRHDAVPGLTVEWQVRGSARTTSTS